MKRLIKIFCMLLCLTIILSLVLGNKMVGCTCEGIGWTRTFEYGDFVITASNKVCDFSKQGLNKETIVIPNYIKGKPLEVHTRPIGFSGVSYSVKFTYSKKIKKIYNAGFWARRSLGDYVNTSEQDIMYYSYPKKILVPTCKVFVIGMSSNCFYTDENTLRNSVNLLMDCVPRATISNVNFDNEEVFTNLYFMANIEFLYNYEDAPKNGVYWLDDLETGETLSYIPEVPIREGYTFGGWFSDAECQNVYDFSAVYEKKEYQKSLGPGGYYFLYPKDYVTKIYAKWIEN